MKAQARNEKTLTLACHWSRDARTGRLEAHWVFEAPVKREDGLKAFTPAK